MASPSADETTSSDTPPDTDMILLTVEETARRLSMGGGAGDVRPGGELGGGERSLGVEVAQSDHLGDVHAELVLRGVGAVALHGAQQAAHPQC
jgi:hypothetical protein